MQASKGRRRRVRHLRVRHHDLARTHTERHQVVPVLRGEDATRLRLEVEGDEVWAFGEVEDPSRRSEHGSAAGEAADGFEAHARVDVPAAYGAVAAGREERIAPPRHERHRRAVSLEATDVLPALDPPHGHAAGPVCRRDVGGAEGARVDGFVVRKLDPGRERRVTTRDIVDARRTVHARGQQARAVNVQ